MEAAERMGVLPPRLELEVEPDCALWPMEPLVPGGAGSVSDSMDEDDPANMGWSIRE